MEGSLGGITRYIMKFRHNKDSYPWEELEEALKNRGYEIVVIKNEVIDTIAEVYDIIAEVYLRKANNVVELVNLCDANNWGVGYAADKKGWLIPTYIKGQASIQRVEFYKK